MRSTKLKPKLHKACESKFHGWVVPLELRKIDLNWLSKPGAIYTSFQHQFFPKYGKVRFKPINCYLNYIDGPLNYRGTIKQKYAMWDWIIRDLQGWGE